MEKGLHERDIVGLQDFVLLEDCNNEDAFIDNLRKRFQENLIYVSLSCACKNCVTTHVYTNIFIVLFYTLLDIYWTSADFHQSVQRAAHLLGTKH